MSEVNQSCQELCTANASLSTTNVTAVGVCEYPVADFILSDVVVTGCTIESALLDRLSDTIVVLVFLAKVEFTYTGIRQDGSTFSESSECQTSVTTSKITPLEEGFTLADVPCTGAFQCSARDAGFDAELRLQELIVTVTGTLECYGCRPAIVNVQLCSSASPSSTHNSLLPITALSEKSLNGLFAQPQTSDRPTG